MRVRRCRGGRRLAPLLSLRLGNEGKNVRLVVRAEAVSREEPVRDLVRAFAPIPLDLERASHAELHRELEVEARLLG